MNSFPLFAFVQRPRFLGRLGPLDASAGVLSSRFLFNAPVALATGSRLGFTLLLREVFLSPSSSELSSLSLSGNTGPLGSQPFLTAFSHEPQRHSQLSSPK